MTVPDGIVALGAIVASELYGLVVPVMVVPREIFESIPSGASAVIRGGQLSWSSRGDP
jgi:predicted aconitase with swiveling domain